MTANASIRPASADFSRTPLLPRLYARLTRWWRIDRPPEAAPIVLDRRRVYILPTRPGLAYAVALLTILLGAMNYNLSLGHALVFLLVSLGLVTILHSFRNLVQLSIRPGRCDPVFAHQPARFELLIENPRPEMRYALRLTLAQQAPLEIDLAAHSTAAVSLRLPATRRGWLPLPRVTIETTWPLGLIRAWGYARPEMRCLVYPAPAAAAPPLPWSGESARGGVREGRGADDFNGLRNHQLTDSPRHVAWKAVARQHEGGLLTKLFAGAAADNLWLDWHALPPTLDTEQRLSILTRWILDADAAGLSWGLILPTLKLAAGHGPAHLAAALRALALFDHGAT